MRLTGRSVDRVAALGVTRTFQTPVMFWGLTVRESLAVALAAHDFGGSYPPRPERGLLAYGLGGRARRRADAALAERADALLAGTGLAGMGDRPTESLAFGEERILELARARAVRPRCCCSTSRSRASTRTRSPTC